MLSAVFSDPDRQYPSPGLPRIHCLRTNDRGSESA